LNTLFGGCAYIVGQSTVGQGPNRKSVNVFCNKLTNAGSLHCAKHELFVADEALEPSRQVSKRRAKRAREAERVALAMSPLRAHNPKFDDVKKESFMEPSEK
jgi:hypothetical protein